MAVMLPRTLVRALVAGALTLGLAVGLAVSGPAQADGPLGPPGPGLLDPVIDVLAPVPTPYTPYDAKACRSGADRCIDVTIRQMKRRLKPLARTCQHDAIFSLAYLRVTEDVRTALGEGHFANAVWLQRVDKIFARLYFRTMDDWHAGRRGQIPQAWRIALRAEDQRTMSGLGNFLLAMNAHINRDFPHVLATAGLTAKNGSHKRDHNAYNSRLDGLYQPVFAEEARRFDPTFDDLDFGPLDEIGVGTIMRGWREVVWRNAEALVLAPDGASRRLVEQGIEQYAAGQAQLIRAMFSSPDSAARDDYCAARRR
jgi:hypothetical protein